MSSAVNCGLLRLYVPKVLFCTCMYLRNRCRSVAAASKTSQSEQCLCLLSKQACCSSLVDSVIPQKQRGKSDDTKVETFHLAVLTLSVHKNKIGGQLWWSPSTTSSHVGLNMMFCKLVTRNVWERWRRRCRQHAVDEDKCRRLFMTEAPQQEWKETLIV